MYEDADQPGRALEIFRSILSEVRRGKPGYQRMPDRYRKALERKIEELVERS